MNLPFVASLSSASYPELFEALSMWNEYCSSGRPEWIMEGSSEINPEDWRTIGDSRAALGGHAYWTSGLQLISRPGASVAIVEVPAFVESMGQVLARCMALPLSVAVLGAQFHDPWSHQKLRRWSLSGGHIDHGWGCLFRGAGHDRLVSRRWLDYGPWRVVHLPNDTTFVQFYDLAISDPKEAYEQAEVGHQRMGVDPIGGYIQGIDPAVIAQVRGLYAPDQRRLEIVIAPRIEVSQQDMRVACALRLHHRLTNPAQGRIQQIAYMFMDRADAEAHLHELWLRELECWYIDETGKHRLDTDYHPTPTPPAWVAGLGAHAVNDL